MFVLMKRNLCHPLCFKTGERFCSLLSYFGAVWGMHVFIAVTGVIVQEAQLSVIQPAEQKNPVFHSSVAFG